MKVLALDLASKTGVAVGDPNTIPLCFTENLGEVGEHHGARFAQAFRMMKRLIVAHQPALIVLEAPFKTKHSKMQIEYMLMGLRGCVMGAAHMFHIPFEQHDVSTIRKHFIGHGRLKRADAKRATIARCGQLGWKVANDDEADAAALWDYACSRQSRSHAISTLNSTTPLFDER